LKRAVTMTETRETSGTDYVPVFCAEDGQTRARRLDGVRRMEAAA
jgi:hypothetical protein